MCLVSRAGADGAQVTYTRCGAKGVLSGIAGLTATGSAATPIAADCAVAGRRGGCADRCIKGGAAAPSRARRGAARQGNSVLVELKLAPTVPD